MTKGVGPFFRSLFRCRKPAPQYGRIILAWREESHNPEGRDELKSCESGIQAKGRDQFSGAFQFDGGNVICQKLGDGEVNSNGIRKPSELSRVARVTRV